MALKKCTSLIISDEYSNMIKDIGKKWRNDLKNPINDSKYKDIENTWNVFIKNWASKPNTPLLIRKKDNGYGTINIHNTGRKLIPVDNSPAQWIFACVCNGFIPPENIEKALSDGIIPVAMVLPKIKDGIEMFRGKLDKCYNTQTLDWYLGHKIGVGLNKKMLDCTIDELKEHFIKFMSPFNMFVVPKDKRMRGLADLKDFIEQQ